jgi:hypothetical protein
MATYLMFRKIANQEYLYVEIDDTAQDAVFRKDDIEVAAKGTDLVCIIQDLDGLATIKNKINMDDANKVIDMINKIKDQST